MLASPGSATPRGAWRPVPQRTVHKLKDTVLEQTDKHANGTADAEHNCTSKATECHIECHIEHRDCTAPRKLDTFWAFLSERTDRPLPFPLEDGRRVWWTQESGQSYGGYWFIS